MCTTSSVVVRTPRSQFNFVEKSAWGYKPFNASWVFWIESRNEQDRKLTGYQPLLLCRIQNIPSGQILKVIKGRIPNIQPNVRSGTGWMPDIRFIPNIKGFRSFHLFFALYFKYFLGNPYLKILDLFKGTLEIWVRKSPMPMVKPIQLS